MTLKEIGYLLEVARCSSISEAAKQLYVAQPSLTHVIQSVEKEVGFRIFDRGRSGVTVTEQGEEFLLDIRAVYEQMAVVQSKYVEKHPEKKRFAVSIQHFSLAGEAFLRVVKTWQTPAYQVKLLEGKSADVISDVSSGRSEIGFLHFMEEKEPVIFKELRKEGLEFYCIKQTAPCLILRHDHPLTAMDEISQKDLEPYPLVSYDYGPDGAVYFSEEGITLLQADRQFTVSDGLMMLDLLTSTQAYAVGLPFMTTLMQANGITTRPLSGMKPLRMGWIKKVGTVLRPLARQYLQMVNPD